MALKRPPEKQWTYRQPPEPFPRLPSSGALLGPTASGKTTTLVAMLTGPMKKCFDYLWIFSPSARLDSSYEPLEKHIRGLKGGGLVDEWDEQKLHEIVQKQREESEMEKRRGDTTRPLTATCIVLDDWIDRPDLMHKQGGLLVSLFIRNRHYGLSCIVLSQKMTSVSLTCRTNFRWMCIWRLRSAAELECVFSELSALYPIQTLRQIYEVAINDQDFSWLYVNMSARKKADMMFVRFEDRLLVNAADEGQTEITDKSKDLHRDRETKRARQDDEPPADQA
jgi:hypothetical protein